MIWFACELFMIMTDLLILSSESLVNRRRNFIKTKSKGNLILLTFEFSDLVFQNDIFSTKKPFAYMNRGLIADEILNPVIKDRSKRIFYPKIIKK